MRIAQLVFGCWLASCGTPALAPTAPSVGAVRHAVLARPLQAASLPFRARVRAPRAAGGFYALGDAGVLARVDRRGRLTGIFQTELTSLATTRDYLCGVDTAQRVLCARDHHQDETCAGAALSPFVAVALARVPRATLVSREAGRTLCLERNGQVLACISGESSCGRICLAFPACAPPRCIDPCPPGRAP